jgi:hypothetical protein
MLCLSVTRSTEIVFSNLEAAGFAILLTNSRAIDVSVPSVAATVARTESSVDRADRAGINIIGMDAFNRSREIGHGLANSPAHAQWVRGVTA